MEDVLFGGGGTFFGSRIVGTLSMEMRFGTGGGTSSTGTESDEEIVVELPTDVNVVGRRALRMLTSTTGCWTSEK